MSNMDTVGTIEMTKVFYEFGMLGCLHKFYTVEEIHAISDEAFFANTIVSTGILDHDLEKLDQIVKACPKLRFVCLDVANGYTQRFIDTVALVRQRYPHLTIIAGNVVTQEISEELILKWADIVKVGIGAWSTCITRIQTGVGYPQLSAVIECSDAAHGIGGRIIADSGIVNPGDVVKAFGAGADFTMMGGMFAGHDQCGDAIIEEWGKKYMEHYGMSSETAMTKHFGWVAEYRASEGKCVKVPYKGDVRNTIQSILWGLRSACTYVGARTLKELPKCTTFIRCSQQSNEVWGKN